jgi:hypothetical protein
VSPHFADPSHVGAREWDREPMEPGAALTQDGRVARLLIFWTQPPHLSAAEANAWVHGELRNVTGVAGVERAELTRLRSASGRFGAPHDWMLELHLATGAAPADCVAAEPCAEWLGDLRLLGMAPVVVVADGEGAV